jgi:uncharacterized membrane protein
MTENLSNDRLETFCDGVFAIAITLLILEIKVPDLKNIHNTSELIQELWLQWPSWFAFLLSFVTLFIAWTNHHNFFKQLDKISSPFIYANGFLMLTVIVLPYPTGVLGRFLNTSMCSAAIILYIMMHLTHGIGWLIMSIAALRPKDLSIDEARHIALRKTTKAIAGFCVFDLLIILLAVWFPMAALGVISIVWIAILIAGAVVTPVD